MSKRKIGFDRLVAEIGEDFFNSHKDTACFSYGDTEKGLHCFLGIDLHPELRTATLSCPIDDWDVYATCYVTDDGVEMDKCKFPVLC